MSAAKPLNWYVVHTAPNAETRIDRRLCAMGMQTFYPFFRIRRKRKLPNRDQHRVEWVNKPRYPRYLFVCCSEEHLWAVNALDGVSTVVYFNGRPSVVADDAITNLMEIHDKESAPKDETRRPMLKPGDTVQFKENSPFYGIVSQVSLDTGKTIRIVSRMFGVDREVEVAPDQVAKIA